MMIYPVMAAYDNILTDTQRFHRVLDAVVKKEVDAAPTPDRFSVEANDSRLLDIRA